MITCPSCGIAKPPEAFYADRSKSSGRRFICRACDRESARARYRAKKGGKVNRYRPRWPAPS